MDERRVLASPVALATPPDVVDWLRTLAPRVVAVDAPRAAAPPGSRSRGGERELVRQVCGIRFTPDRRLLRSNRSYYDWIRRGFVLYRALERAGFAVVECFPTASWTVWAGPRGAKSRAAWTASALAGLALDAVPVRLGQDARDAIAAAVTARLHDCGRTRSFAELVVPRGPSP
ncbi:MAG: DUF429 domain-containing protein [Actinomycetota bacterium]|nr:DUF429 domain-containing protein [Actinomycetota bacterium]